MNARKTYLQAVTWIAENDSPADDDNAVELSGLLTVALIADLFNKPQIEVASDVLRIRRAC